VVPTGNPVHGHEGADVARQQRIRLAILGAWLVLVLVLIAYGLASVGTVDGWPCGSAVGWITDRSEPYVVPRANVQGRQSEVRKLAQEMEAERAATGPRPGCLALQQSRLQVLGAIAGISGVAAIIAIALVPGGRERTAAHV
jgi:hypothetical protein